MAAVVTTVADRNRGAGGAGSVPAPADAGVPDLADRVAAYCGRAGMDEGDPLRLALVTACRAAVVAEAAVRDGARGLTPEGEKELVERVSRGIALRTEGMVERRTRRLGWRAVAVVSGLLVGCMAAAGGVGYWAGDRVGTARALALSETLQGTDGLTSSSASRWAEVIRANPDAARVVDGAECRKTAQVSEGWRGCRPWLWLGRAVPPGR